MNIHYLILGLALLFAVIAIVRPAVWPLPVAVILIAIELFSRVSKAVVVAVTIGILLAGMSARAQSTIPPQIQAQLPPGAPAFNTNGLSFTNVTYKAALGTEIANAGTLTYAQADWDAHKFASFDIGLGAETTFSAGNSGLHSASADLELIKNFTNWQLVGKAGFGRNFEDNVANFAKFGFDVNYNLTQGGLSFLGTSSGGFTYVGAGVSWANTSLNFNQTGVEKTFRIYVGFAF